MDVFLSFSFFSHSKKRGQIKHYAIEKERKWHVTAKACTHAHCAHNNAPRVISLRCDAHIFFILFVNVCVCEKQKLNHD